MAFLSKNANSAETMLTRILSTFKFTDRSQLDFESVSFSARKIDYGKVDSWETFVSSVGYSFQHPKAFYNADKLGEQLSNGECAIVFGNDVGGILKAKVVTYNGGSRRQLYGIEDGYYYRFEEVLIQDKNSLIIEAGPLGDSGSGSGVVVSIGNYALIISWNNRGKDSQEFSNLLKSIKVNNSLDFSKCVK
ncbi:MAG: hypothetical protein M1150_03250 [Patescibacteria group bacterium]|nr:hypothetical protein [Patescibacteria group bacterium]